MARSSAYDDEFTEYVSARSAWLRQVAFLLCGDWHAADELLQVAVTRLYLNWSRVRAVENSDGYARTVLVNAYLAERRSSWVRRVIPFGGYEERPAADGDLDGVLDLRRALVSLPPRQRAVLVLRYYCDLSVEETAFTLRCSQGNVKSQTARGIDRLRRMLHPHAEEVSS
ncbi:SigE family RNA polymerase sigma factor [Herbidospora galbida]|uniref:SigE family RNA polymerase sigma factor n=1 Tax=Herbidospora galbida TaxID=2575442 RepID=A0A4U3MIY0_9ACTN|nr:SigE family RNA polymerase sigma factor [Herbidospora galbida]TKK87956.1 SigE family RNA polymerase sigma factor [Herbidospora galbida]